MVRSIVVCALCVGLALPAAAEESASGVLEGLWNDLVALVAEVFQPADVNSGLASEGDGELWPTFIPNGVSEPTPVEFAGEEHAPSTIPNG